MPDEEIFVLLGIPALGRFLETEPQASIELIWHEAQNRPLQAGPA